MKHICINFLPGSAGNFLTRFLQCLLENSYCWLNDTSIPDNFTDKIKLLEYKTIVNSKRNWVEFEKRLKHFSESIDISSLQNKSTLIWLGHLLTLDKIKNKNIIGNDDSYAFIQITYDTKEELEWILLNAFYKNSFIDRTHFDTYQQNVKDENVRFFSVSNFLNWDSFSKNVLEILDQNEIDYNLENINELQIFYNDWYNTTLKLSEFNNFKKSIEWLL